MAERSKALRSGRSLPWRRGFELGMGIRLNCLNRSSGELMIDFRLIINIFILKFTIYRLYENAVKIEKTQRVSSLRSLLPDEQLLWQLNLQEGQLLWQLNGIRSMVTLENMRCCTLKQRSRQLEAGAHKHNSPSFFFSL